MLSILHQKPLQELLVSLSTKLNWLIVQLIQQINIYQIVEMGINNLFGDVDSTESTVISTEKSNTANLDSISIVDKPVTPFNSDKDFVNFQLGEFGVNTFLVFHLTQQIQPFDSMFYSFVSNIFTNSSTVIRKPFQVSFILDMSYPITISFFHNNSVIFNLN